MKQMEVTTTDELNRLVADCEALRPEGLVKSSLSGMLVFCNGRLFSPATDANHALDIFEKVDLTFVARGKLGQRPWIAARSDAGAMCSETKAVFFTKCFSFEAPTFCIAICLAALRDVGTPVDWKPKA